jgi:hypothetical protein
MMGQYASEFLPFSLQFVDHWEVAHMTTGLLCLQRVVNELTSSELKWFGRSELILNALMGLVNYFLCNYFIFGISNLSSFQMHVKEPHFHDILFPCISKTICKSIGPKNSFGNRIISIF